MIKGKKLIDLHVHLDGSLSFFMARHLAAMQHMDQKTDAALKDLLVVILNGHFEKANSQE